MKAFFALAFLCFCLSLPAATFTVVYDSDTLKVRDVLEGKASFAGPAPGVRYGRIETETPPAKGDTLAAEPEEGAQRAAVTAALQGEIATLNAKYDIALSASDSFAKAAAKLFGAGALKTEVTYLKTLFDALKEME